MRLSGNFNPRQDSSLANVFGHKGRDAAHLHLKTGKVEELVADAQFKSVKGEIVDDKSKNVVEGKADEAFKYHLYSAKSKPRNLSQAKNPKVFQKNLDQKLQDPYLQEIKDLNKQLKSLKNDINDVKALAISNRQALNPNVAMPVNHAKPNSYSSTNQDNSNQGSTLDKANLYYQRNRSIGYA